MPPTSPRFPRSPHSPRPPRSPRSEEDVLEDVANTTAALFTSARMRAGLSPRGAPPQAVSFLGPPEVNLYISGVEPPRPTLGSASFIDKHGGPDGDSAHVVGVGRFGFDSNYGMGMGGSRSLGGYQSRSDGLDQGLDLDPGFGGFPYADEDAGYSGDGDEDGDGEPEALLLPNPDELLEMVIPDEKLAIRDPAGRSGLGGHVDSSGQHACTVCDWTHDMFAKVGADEGVREQKISELAAENDKLARELQEARQQARSSQGEVKRMRDQAARQQDLLSSGTDEVTQLRSRVRVLEEQLQAAHAQDAVYKQRYKELQTAIRDGFVKWRGIQGRRRGGAMAATTTTHSGNNASHDADSSSMHVDLGVGRGVGPGLGIHEYDDDDDDDDDDEENEDPFRSPTDGLQAITPDAVVETMGILAGQTKQLMSRVRSLMSFVSRGAGWRMALRESLMRPAFQLWRARLAQQRAALRGQEADECRALHTTMHEWRRQAMERKHERVYDAASELLEHRHSQSLLRGTLRTWRQLTLMALAHKHQLAASARLMQQASCKRVMAWFVQRLGWLQRSRHAQLSEAMNIWRLHTLGSSNENLAEELQSLTEENELLRTQLHHVHSQLEQTHEEVAERDDARRLYVLGKATRLTRVSTLRRALSYWRIVTRDEHCELQCAKISALRRWQAQLESTRHAEQAQRLAAALAQWKQASIRAAARLRRESTVVRMFHRWRIFSKHRAGLTRAQVLFTEQTAARKRERCFQVWRRVLVRKQWMRDNAERIVAVRNVHRRYRAWLAWRAALQMRNRGKQLVQRVLVGRLTKQPLRRAWNRWRQFSAHWVAEQVLQDMVDGHEQEKAELVRASDLEKEALLQQAQMLMYGVQRGIERKRNGYIAARHFHLWMHLLQQRRTAKKVLGMVVRVQRQRMLRGGLQKWLEFMQHDREHQLHEQHQTEVQALEENLGSQLAKAKAETEAAASKQYKLGARLSAAVMLQRNRDRLRVAVLQWRREAARTASGKRLAQRFRDARARRAVQVCFLKWRAEFQRADMLQGMGDYFRGRRDERLLRDLYLQWRGGHVRHVLVRRVATKFQAKQKRSVVAAALLRWRSFVADERLRESAEVVQVTRRRLEEAEAGFEEEREEMLARIERLRGNAHVECDDRIQDLEHRVQHDMAIQEDAAGRIERLGVDVHNLRRTLEQVRDKHRRLQRAHELLKAAKLGDVDVSGMFFSQLVS